MPRVTPIVELAVETVAMVSRKGKYPYMEDRCLGDAAYILKHDILLISENDGKAHNATLYGSAGVISSYVFDKNGILVPGDHDDSRELTSDTIVIAGHHGHFYGIPTFASKRLRVALDDGRSKEIRKFEDLFDQIQSVNSLGAGVLGSFSRTASSESSPSSDGMPGSDYKPLPGVPDDRPLREISGFEEVQKKLNLYYESPMYDSVYKRVFLDAGGGEIGGLLCECLLTLRSSGDSENCEVTEAKARQESINPFKVVIDGVLKTIRSVAPSGGVDGLVSQNLKVDAWYDVKIRHGEAADEIGAGKKDGEKQVTPTFPAFVLAEMQIKKCEMAIRLLSYACMIFSRSKVDLSATPPAIPPPVFAFAFCMWKSASEKLMDLKSIQTKEDGGDETHSTEISIGSIFLGDQVTPVLDDDTGKLKDREATLAREQANLRAQILAFANDKKKESEEGVVRNFDNLDVDFKRLSLLLDFIKLAHLKTPEDVKQSLEVLPVNDPARKIFQLMYDKIKIEDQTMSNIRVENPDLYGVIAEKIRRENKPVNNLINVVLTLDKKSIGRLPKSVRDAANALRQERLNERGVEPAKQAQSPEKTPVAKKRRKGKRT
jgi:hypothetical protein